jgi:hypothetical protein
MDAVSVSAEKTGAEGFPPDHVARAVEHALTARKPKTRYLVGSGAGFRAFLKTVLPDRFFDQLIIRHIGLPGNP